MKWNKFTIKTTTEAEDYLSAMLDEIGVEGMKLKITSHFQRKTSRQCLLIFCRNCHRMTVPVK